MVAFHIVLFDLSTEERRELSDILIPKKDTVIISVGKLDSFVELGKSAEVQQASTILNELYQITTQDGTPHGMIFPVTSILDIRDIKYADSQEKVELVSRLYDICSAYEKDYGVKDAFDFEWNDLILKSFENRETACKDSLYGALFNSIFVLNDEIAKTKTTYCWRKGMDDPYGFEDIAFSELVGKEIDPASFGISKNKPKNLRIMSEPHKSA